MTEIIFPQDDGDPIRVDLRQPYWAAFFSWLLPGAGQLYQRRYAKGWLFMITILGLYLLGLALGHGRVVYASNDPNDNRWFFYLQMGVAGPSLPALLQRSRVNGGADPLFVLCERYPEDYGNPKSGTEEDRKRVELRFQRITPENNFENYQGRTLKDGLMAPPAGPVNEMTRDVLGQWQAELHHFFDLGTYYTVFAGLLNILVIYDAFVGPAIMTPRQKRELRKKGSEASKPISGDVTGEVSATPAVPTSSKAETVETS